MFSQRIAYKKFIFLAVFILLAAQLNIAGSVISSKMDFPLYMDSFATIAVAAVGGLLPSLAVAILTNGTLFLLGHLKLIFILCQLMTAAGSFFIFKFAKKRGEVKFSLDSFMLCGILSAVTNGIFGSLFAAAYHYNLTAIEQGLYLVTKNVIISNLAGGFILNIVDKAIASFIAYGMYLRVNKKCASDWSISLGVPRGERNRVPIARKYGKSALKEVKNAHKLKIKAEYIFLLAAFFSFCLSFGFKKVSDKIFDVRYKEAIKSGQYKNIEEHRGEERFINKGFDSFAYASFFLASISIFIMQLKLKDRKNQIKILNAQQETQKAFSRDLHDGIIQSLAALKICLSQGEHKKAVILTDEAIRDTREILGLSRMDLSDDFKMLISQYAKVFEENYKIKIDVYEASKEAKSFSFNVKYEMLKILQEALANACKHGMADRIEIKMIDQTSEFSLSVCDNGCGFNFDAIKENVCHAGLKIMEERAASFGGKIKIKSDKNGTTVSLILSING